MQLCLRLCDYAGSSSSISSSVGKKTQHNVDKQELHIDQQDIPQNT